MNKGPTIFLLDDDPAVLKAFLRLLRIAGYNAEGFSSAREFMDRYNPAMAGCLLLDLSMPGITGLDVQEWLAKLGNPLPIIFVTGNDAVPARVLAAKQGVVDVLSKPVTKTTLLTAIERALLSDSRNRSVQNRPEPRPARTYGV